MQNIINYIDSYRKQNRFYMIRELIEIIGTENTLIDPFSLLISKNIQIGKGNIFFPGVTLISDDSSSLSIGDNNVFSNGTRIESANNASIAIGNSNSFNDGIISVKCNIKGGAMIFGDRCRFDGRINIFGNCSFGNGAQIIGTINVYNCTLLAGGDYSESDPDKRAGLLKGFGTAKNVSVGVGMVINGIGDFDSKKVEWQSNYHKK
jgi:hypothetical protein